MKKIIRLTESDLSRIVKRVISEQGKTSAVSPTTPPPTQSRRPAPGRTSTDTTPQPNTQQGQSKNWVQIAERLVDAMSGMGTDEVQIARQLSYVQSGSDWDALFQAFGSRQGQNLFQWLYEDLGAEEYSKLVTRKLYNIGRSGADRLYIRK